MKKSKRKKHVKIDSKPEETTIEENTHIEFVVIPPDGGWGWVIVFASFFSNMVVDGIMYTFGIFLTDLTNEFHSTEANVGWANSILTGFYYMCGPVICALTNRCGFRNVGLIGAIIGSSSLGIASISPTLQIYIVAYGVFGGIGFSMCYISNILVVGFYFERWRALATAISVSGSSIGTIIIPPIFNMFLSHYTWRAKYRILSVSALVAGMMTLTYKPIAPSKVYPESDDDRISMASSAVSEGNPKSIFYRKHNAYYPTNADYVQGSFTVLAGRGMDAGPSNSVNSMRTYRTWVTRQSSLVSGFSVRDKRRTCCTSDCCVHEALQRPMYKDDILFTGSVATLPNYDRNRIEKQQASLEYHMSVTRVATLKDMEEGGKCCVCCPQSVIRTLATMLDFTLLAKPSFFLLAVSGFFTYFGFFVPFLYVVDFARSRDIHADKATFLISAIGISNLVGRLATGLVSLMPRHSAMYITDVCLVCTGIATILAIFANTTFEFFAFAIVYGTTTSCLATLRPIMAVDLYGLDKLTNAIGIIVLFGGLAAMTGVPIATNLKEMTGSYEAPFLFAGTTILLGAFLLFPLKPLKQREMRKEAIKEQVERQRKQDETRKKLEQINKLGQKSGQRR